MTNEQLIKNIIRPEMKKQNISAYRLSKLSGVSQSTLSEFFNGKSEMKSGNMLSVFEVLGINIETNGN